MLRNEASFQEKAPKKHHTKKDPSARRPPVVRMTAGLYSKITLAWYLYSPRENPIIQLQSPSFLYQNPF
jgi:hypothetical protein